MATEKKNKKKSAAKQSWDETTPELFIQRVKALLSERSWTRKQLADMLGIGATGLIFYLVAIVKWFGFRAVGTLDRPRRHGTRSCTKEEWWQNCGFRKEDAAVISSKW